MPEYWCATHFRFSRQASHRTLLHVLHADFASIPLREQNCLAWLLPAEHYKHTLRDVRGFIQRKRKFSGSSFAQSLIFGWQSNPQASLEELCQSSCASGVSISPQGLQDRLNSPQAATFMKELLQQAVNYVVTGEGERQDLLSRFSGVYIQDSTIIELPLALRDWWAGCGNQTRKKLESKYKLT